MILLTGVLVTKTTFLGNHSTTVKYTYNTRLSRRGSREISYLLLKNKMKLLYIYRQQRLVGESAYLVL